ncbi:hypothetical protein COV93_01925 [Candidatus Woesearchaeota archaeon CG11_big_fil_rev_8_21_14_0_20_43_8]|nr:MAG: hypothetical protein COV93_01925 [Candidatus Woesearchaeota archaeon CG11_big_fil_rev_8_21_14_0_20_43_8]PIO05688.1 MAG: hypothetical protein COT47_03730 [Candidatus Woesearchaeota archaeon CG08_land_8_20_14_0_20_43_7]
MEIGEAVLILAKELTKRGKIKIIDGVLAPVYLKDAAYVHMTDEEGMPLCRSHGRWSNQAWIRQEELQMAIDLGANYIFISRSSCISDHTQTIYSDLVSPFAVIGADEKKDLLKIYKGIDEKTLEAMRLFDVDRSVMLYKEYLGDGVQRADHAYFLAEKDLLSFKKALQTHRQSLEKGNMPGVLIHKEIERKEYENRGFSINAREAYARLIDIIEFTKTLPAKDIDPEIDLSFYNALRLPDKKEMSLFLDLYNERPGLFKAVFDGRKSDHQKMLLEEIAKMPKEKQDTGLNSYLCRYGQKNLYINYIDLYLHDPESFAIYFDLSSDGYREEILMNIMDSAVMMDYIVDPQAEKKVSDYLEAHHGELLDRIGRKLNSDK